MTLAEHRPPRGEGPASAAIRIRRKQAILTAAPEIADLCRGAESKRPQGGRACPAATAAPGAGVSARTVAGRLAEAARYGLYDLDRLERMILRRVTRDYFLPGGNNDD